MSFKQLSIGCATAGALVLLAACSSAGSSDAKASTGSAKPTASPSPTVTPATVAQLRKIVLQATDLPPGWKRSPVASDDGTNSNEDLAACVGAKNTDADQIASVDSDDYDLGNAEISASASSYKSQSDLATDIAIIKSPKFLSCTTQGLKQELATSMPKGTTVGAVSLKFTAGPGRGPANVVGSGSMSMPVIGNAGKMTVYVDFVYLTGPLIEAEVDAENLGAPVPASVLQAAVQAVASRAATGG
jgi:hypothetical protein